MVYNNFILRLLFSVIFIFIYLICLYINLNYIFYLILLIYLLISIEIFFYFKKYKYLSLIYIIISFSFFITLEFDEQIILNFNLYILIVISFDIFSYLVGKNFGENKLIKISPNKTYEGLFGGIIISLLVSLLFSFAYEIKINLELVFFIIIIIFSAFIGDIVESYLKRKNNIKNSSEFIPGHGGVFDRFDSFIFSIIFYSISINTLL
tara:strand:- start:1462 stop:2085 length:624 start_codon:yes stop_codon:yes gene_type:complete